VRATTERFASVRIGLQIPAFTWPGAAELGATFGAIAERAEQAGFDSLWVMDHLFQIGTIGPPDMDMLEGWSALAFAAARTHRIKLGTMVTAVTYRYPGVLVKTATTLDVLSGGRAYFGIGAAWNEFESQSLGIPFPPVAERFERLEETLRIALQMWSDAGKQLEAKPFAGQHYQLERTLNVPQSIQRPHPPILIGGGGEKKTLRLVAQYADACNIFARMEGDFIKHKLEVLQEHCEQVGRPYAAIEKTSLGGLRLTRDGRDGSKTPAQALDQFGQLAALGIEHALVSFPNVSDPALFELLATDVVPQMHQLAVAGRS
jgi:F420-dependent oxidoreductase-like protein